MGDDRGIAEENVDVKVCGLWSGESGKESVLHGVWKSSSAR